MRRNLAEERKRKNFRKNLRSIAGQVILICARRSTSDVGAMNQGTFLAVCHSRRGFTVESYELKIPPEDPHWIYDIFDANFGNKILVAAATHFNVFLHLKYENLSHEELSQDSSFPIGPWWF